MDRGMSIRICLAGATMLVFGLLLWSATGPRISEHKFLSEASGWDAHGDTIAAMASIILVLLGLLVALISLTRTLSGRLTSLSIKSRRFGDSIGSVFPPVDWGKLMFLSGSAMLVVGLLVMTNPPGQVQGRGILSFFLSSGESQMCVGLLMLLGGVLRGYPKGNNYGVSIIILGIASFGLAYFVFSLVYRYLAPVQC